MHARRRLAAFDPWLAVSYDSGMIRHTTIRILVAASVLLAAGAGFGRPRMAAPWQTPRAAWRAAGQQDQNSDFNLEGKITDRTANKLTVSTQDNIIFHVTFDEKTPIYRKDGTQGAGADLKVGTSIKVDGSLSDSGVITAKRIDLE